MKEYLILLTTAFPYGRVGTYLETEVQYYDKFDAVQIVSLNILKGQRKHIRKLPSNKFKVLPIFRAPNLVYLVYAFRVLFDKNFYTEVLHLIKEKRFSIKRLIHLFIYLSKAHRDAGKIIKYFKKDGRFLTEGKGVIYSYRLEYQAYVGLLIRKYLPNYIFVSRGHGSDLYEEENAVKYIPLQGKLIKQLDRAIMISDHGKNYLSSKYPEFSKKIVVSRLGTVMHPVKETPHADGGINIVSCSNVIPVKRVDLIVKSLSLIKNFKVHWTHYGDGVCLPEIISLSEQCLGPNITYDFRSEVDNQQILQEYSTYDYHLFINVSSSEGIPVSIMEATSYGIPCIATDVGGTREIIKSGENGILLDSDFKPNILAKYINEFAYMSNEKYQNFRHNARLIWQTNYCADKNYPEFVEMLINLLNKSTTA